MTGAIRRIALFAAVLLSVTGCGRDGTADKQLAVEAPKLVRIYLNSRLNRQLQENQGKGLQFFAMPDNGIFFIAKERIGLETAINRHPELREFRLASFYMAAELRYEVLAITVGAIHPSGNPRVPRRGSMSVKLREIQRFWNSAPGLPVYGIVEAGQLPAEIPAQIVEKKLTPFLPPENVDGPYLLQTGGEERRNEFTVMLFADYDADSAGWVLAETDMAVHQSIRASAAGWDARSDAVANYRPRGMTMLHGRLYPTSDAELLNHYDNGQIRLQDRWMSRQEAAQFNQLAQAMKELGIDQVSLEKMDAFLKLLPQCPEAPNRAAATELAVAQGRELLRRMAANNDLTGLQEFGRKLAQDSTWRELAVMAAERAGAEAEATAHGNRLLNECQQHIRQMETDLRQLDESDLSMVRADIILERVADGINRECPETAAELQTELRLFALAYALDHDGIDYLNRFSRNMGAAESVRNAEKQLRSPCGRCRNGHIPCEECRDGKCSRCGGSGMIGAELCPLCHGRSLCAACNGRQNIPCPICAGRGFVINRTAVRTLRQSALGRIRQAFQKRIETLEHDKRPEPSAQTGRPREGR